MAAHDDRDRRGGVCVRGEAFMKRSRKPEIMADAAHAIFNREARLYTGNFVRDEQVLREEGCTDFDDYRFDRADELEMDLFVDS
jgi:citronellol/citronellal dehydrogenase